MSKSFVSIILMLSMLITTGCGDGGAAVLKRRSNLHELGMAYHRFLQANQKSPAGAGEMSEFMKSQSADDPKVQDAIISLEEGDIVMIWNGNLGDASENPKYVLGFEAGAPSTGGYVVMGDGVVRLMTAKEYTEATMLPTPD